MFNYILHFTYTFYTNLFPIFPPRRSHRGPLFLSIKLTSLTSKDLIGHLFSTLNLDIFTLPVFHLFDLELY